MKKSQPKKGILKKSQDLVEKNNELTWDEKGIEEYDKERGKCMKVTEPKTPYNEMTEEQKKEYEELGKQVNSEVVPHQQNGKIDLEALNKRLQQESLSLHIEKKIIDSDDEQEMLEEERKKNEEFKKKRAEHYKMNFKQLKKKEADDDSSDSN